MSFIKLENVSKFYSSENNVALGIHKVSASFELGEIVAITGESGSGKSTFLNVIAGMDTFEEGEIYFKDEPLSGFTKEELEDFRKDNVGFIFQYYNIIDSYTVLQNVMLPLLIRGIKPKEARKEATKIIERVGLKHRIHNRGTKLSGGERQRCVIARALAANNKILACDEPTGNLDSETGKGIIELIKEISKDHLVLIVTHNYDEVSDIATRHIKFFDGQITSDEILKEPSEAHEFDTPSYKMSLLGYMNLAFKNLISTPKKLILTLLVFMVIGAVLLNQVAGIFYSQGTDFISYNDYYENVHPNRLVCYNLDGSPIEGIDLDSSKVNRNSFAEDLNFYSNDLYLNLSLVTIIDANTKITGSMPKNSNEVMIGTSASNMFMYENFIGKTLTIQGKGISVSGSSQTYSYKVTGIFAYYDNTSQTFLYVDDYTYNTLLLEEMGKADVNFYGNNIDSIFKSNLTDTNVSILDSYSKIELYCPMANYVKENLDYLNLTFFDFVNIKINKEEIEFIEADNFIDLHIPASYLGANLSANDYQLSYYASNSKDLDNTKAYLESKGLSVVIPSRMKSDFDVFSSILTQIGLVVQIVSLIINFTITFFLSYLVLNKIYKTKMKEYTVFRTLGMNHHKLAKEVIVEQIMLAIFSAVIVIALMLVLKMFTPLAKLYLYLDWWAYLSYILIMILFGVFIARRFNKRVFKFTVSDNLRREGIAHD